MSAMGICNYKKHTVEKISCSPNQVLRIPLLILFAICSSANKEAPQTWKKINKRKG